jgi:hypothetical protein
MFDWLMQLCTPNPAIKDAFSLLVCNRSF